MTHKFFLGSAAVLVALASISDLARAAAGTCPDEINGKWLCHEQGTPGEGTDETTFALEIKTRLQDGVIVAYDLSGSNFPLDNQFRIVPSLSRGPNSGSTLDWYRRSRCEAGTLITDYEGRTASGDLA